jgi:hypothetical protein
MSVPRALRRGRRRSRLAPPQTLLVHFGRSRVQVRLRTGTQLRSTQRPARWYDCGDSGDIMRRRRQRFIPIFLIALVIQILAPIAASWAAAIAASDPLGAAAICFNHPEPAGDQGTDRHAADGGLCSICCSAPANASFDRLGTAGVVLLYREPSPVLWRDDAMEFFANRSDSTWQARAPPRLT